MDTLGYANPVFALFMLSIAIEIWIVVRRRGLPFPWKESFVSLFIALGSRGATALYAIPLGYISLLVWEHRLITVPLSVWWGWLLLFIGHEFCYYWYHRCAHEIRWFWANHRVHHTAEHLTFSAAYRLGWTNFISGLWLFMIPLVWLGFRPDAVFGMFTASLVYQFWIHTDLVPKLGPLEHVLNTPSNHRVHHAVNNQYLNTNYGAVLIIFDRLFGTYAAERDDVRCRYGVRGAAPSNNPFKILFHEWIEIARDLRSKGTLRDKLMYIFGPPGWRPGVIEARREKAPERSLVGVAQTEKP